ncbi:MAG TPA: LamG domain-containing protein [Burkholderiaceae bacterium]|nr:LamG domain-containing protein [Burkholderiaceae bacterium]
MRRSLAALFACALVAGCGSDGPPPGNASNNPGPPPAGTNFSLHFFGTGSGDIDRVKIPLLDPSTNPRPVNIGATDFTIEFWIKGAQLDNPTAPCRAGLIGKDAWASGAVVIDRDVLGDGDFGEYGVSLFGGQVAFGVNHVAGGQTVCGGQNVLDGNWHHVALTRQFASGAMKIFVDGAQDAAQTDANAAGDVRYNAAHSNPDVNDQFLVLGAEKHDTGLAFNGLIDELRLSNVLRYTATFTPPAAEFVVDADTMALYHFDESSGTDIVDALGNASPGVLLPAATGAASNRSSDTPF